MRTNPILNRVTLIQLSRSLPGTQKIQDHSKDLLAIHGRKALNLGRKSFEGLASWGEAYFNIMFVLPWHKKEG